MFYWLGKIASACWRLLSRYVLMNKDDNEDVSMVGANDASIWYKDLEKHFCGEFSFAMVKANIVMEDHSQVETGENATFVGVYDGHGGPEASRFISNHLFSHIIRLVQESGQMSEEVIRSAFSATEEGFISLVRRAYAIRPILAAVGSCCLIGFIWKETLYVANLGDSRAVLGCVGRSMLGSICRSKRIAAMQLTEDHNACMKEVREELKTSHPDDSQIVMKTNSGWRIKGIIQVSRSIGDAYLKSSEFSLGKSFPRFYIPEPIRQPVLRADPSIYTRILQPSDKFLIFASDGLWEHLSNQEAVEIVYNSPRVGIARRLLRFALVSAVRKAKMTYDELKECNEAERRSYHDDITVVVIFIDQGMLEDKVSVPELSVRGFMDTVGASNFGSFQGM